MTEPNLLDAIREFPVEERGEINRSKLGWLLKKNANRIVGGFEFQQAEADGRTAWRVVAVKSPPLTPSPPYVRSVAKTVTPAGGTIGRGGNMSPTEIIERAAEGGVLIALSPSGRISAKGVQSAIDRWLPAIRQNKAAIIGLLRPGDDGWSAEDWRAFFDERAGIAEFDGGLSRAEAEASAFDSLRRRVAEPQSDALSTRALFRLRRRRASRMIASCLLASEARARFGCIRVARSAWYAGRKAEAVAALAAMGIRAPANLPNDFGKNGGT